MDVSVITEPNDVTQAKCLVCSRPVVSRNFGVFSCSACRMFFRRTLDQKQTYTCQHNQTCFKMLNISTKCRACRFQKCLEAGMKDYVMLELENGGRLAKILKDLMEMDLKRRSKVFGFYSEDDPTLAEVLENRDCVKNCGKYPSTPLNMLDWSFLLNYLVIPYFLDFDFISNLPNPDKFILFKANTLKASIFCGSMRVYLMKKDRMMPPNGKDYDTKALTEKFRKSKKSLNLMRSRIVTKLIELKITTEEFVLLNSIFFCDPTASCLSEYAVKTLTTHQQSYCSSLFQYCQIIYQKNGPTRFMELLSICRIVNKNASELQYIVMVFESSVPNVKYKKLIYDTFDLPGRPF